MSQASLETQLLALLDRIRVLYGCREVAPLLQAATDALCQLADAERAFFFLPDAATGNLALARGQDRQGGQLTEAEGRVLQVARGVYHDRREVIATNAPGQAAGPVARAPITELRLRLLVCLPLMLDDACIGVVYADGKAAPGQGVQTRLMHSLAEHIACALDNAYTYERASNDLLTGLPNNSYFLSQLTKIIKAAPQAGPGGVLLIDLDDFKRVNQAAGAEMGDRALCDIAHALRENLRSDGLVARYDADKFAVLLAPEPSVKLSLRLRDVAERVRAAVSARVFFGIRLSACIGGVACGLEAPRRTPQEVVAFCDNMLARARARGTGEVEIA